MTPRHVWLPLALLLLGAAPEHADLLIRNGTIVSGDAAPFAGDVALAGDRIVAVGPHLTIAAARTVDAHGMVVAPGFIDPHTHVGDELLSADAKARLIPEFLLQGVTTAFIGNDGGGAIDSGAVLASAATRPTGINYATYTGFGTIREAVIGMDARAPSSAELQRMRTMVASAICHGAIGLSTGLFYAPQSFSKTDEVIALSEEAGTRGGFYDTHLRDESSYTIGLAAAVDEAIAIGRAAHVPIHISHIKALGVDVQGQAPAIIAKVAAARAAGENVTASQYPWSASGTSLVAALIPLWAQDGGRPALLRRLDDPALAKRLRDGIADNLRRRGGAEALLITEGAQAGRRLSEIAATMHLPPVEAAIAVIRVHDPATASFNMSEADIAAFMRQPWVMTDSDASPGHPRLWGTFARKYDTYVRQRRVLTLREFVERSATLTADTFRLAGRGHLAPGAFADVVVFDPARYAERATYTQPTLPAVGVKLVVVNGRVAVEDGKLTGVAAGRALPHAPPPGTCPA